MFSRGRKTWHRLAQLHPMLNTRAGAGLVGMGVLGVLAAFASSSSNPEKRIFIEREIYDFKNANVLGTPERQILDGEERQLAKAKSVSQEMHSSQEALRVEIAALREEISKLKDGGSPSGVEPETPVAAASPIPIQLTPVVHELTDTARRQMEGAASRSRSIRDSLQSGQAAPDFGFRAPTRDSRKSSQGKS
ncbi:MAG: hypothetical protein AAB425_00920, partial [Bdellovibrionota bacterium]